MDRPERFEDDVEDGLAAVPDQKTLVLVGSELPRGLRSRSLRVVVPPPCSAHTRSTRVQRLNPYLAHRRCSEAVPECGYSVNGFASPDGV